MTVESALIIHCVAISLASAYIAFVLWRRGLLTILHSGPWVLLAVMIYFLYNPLAALVTGDLSVYQAALVIFTGEGSSRVLWILAVILVGLAVWLFFYTRKGSQAKERAMAATPVAMGRWSLPQVTASGLFLMAALYSILFLRTEGQFLGSMVAVDYDKGRIVGGATGYSVVAHAFFLFIVALLLFRGRWSTRSLGGALAVGFVALRLYDSHDRSSIVSLVAAVAMVGILRTRTGSLAPRTLLARLRRNKLKSAVVLSAAVFITILLVARGHVSVTGVEDWSWERGQRSLLRNDTAMLPALYVWTFEYEREGYEYGLPFVGKALFGWIPRRYAPWKDDLTKWVLGREELRYRSRYEFWFIGPKATVMGSFYGHGGAVGVIVGMALLGMATRQLDRLVAAGKTDLGRVIGIVWLANVWMMFASSDTWIMSVAFIYAIPFLGLWFVSRLEERKLPRLLLPNTRMVVRR